MIPTAKEALYSLINRVNGTEFSVSNTTLSAPQINTNPAFASKNTSVQLSGIPSTGKVGTVTLYYNRRQIAEWLGGAVFECTKENETRIVDLLPRLNDDLGLKILEEDIIDNALPSMEDGPATFSLIMNTDSYGFTGQIQIKLYPAVSDVGDDVENPDLNGLNSSDLEDDTSDGPSPA